MKKKMICLLAALACLMLCLAGCGNDRPDPDDSGRITAATTGSTLPEQTTAPTTAAPTEAPTEAPTAAPTTAVHFETMREKMHITYRGTMFALGDSIDPLLSLLGTQAAPANEVPSCFAAADVTEYYFTGMTLQVLNGRIITVELSDNGYTGDLPATVTGLSLQSKPEEIEEMYGPNESEYDFAYIYYDGQRRMEIYCENGAITSIQLLAPDLVG